MQWNNDELAEGARLANEMGAWAGPRSTRPADSSITLRLSDGLALTDGLPPPPNPRSLFIRHLLQTLGLDEHRVFHWRVEHKLVQALLLAHWCPGAVPVTRGLGRALSGLSPAAARAWFQRLDARALLVKAALGQGSGELRHVDQSSLALDTLLREDEELSSPRTASDERFIIQQRLRIVREYRVHSLEDTVIPDLCFRRYDPERTHADECEAPTAFVRDLLARLPAGFVKDTLYGWDVAADEGGRWHVVELNPSGFHPRFKRGFHTSGFFQTAAWGPSCTATLLDFMHRRYGVTVDIALDADGPAAERAAYASASRSRPPLTPHGQTSRASIDRERPDLARLQAWNDTTRPYPARQPVHALVEDAVRRHPQAIAVVDDRERLTYAELNDGANRLAHDLRARGVAAETRVGICMGRGVRLIMTLLAVLKAGGAYVPLAVSAPRERLRQMVQGAAIAMVLTDRATSRYVSDCGIATLDLDPMWSGLAHACADNPDWSWFPEQLAYVIHTSGSTGRPKAVGVQHTALTNFLWDLKDALRVTAQDRWLAVTPLTFDIAALELLLPLIVGAQVWMAGDGDLSDSAVLRRRLSSGHATIMQATPMTWDLLIGAGWPGGAGFRALVGGEALPPTLANALATRVGVAWNVYGPTETTIWSSLWPIDDSSQTISIGRPIANTQMYVLDAEMTIRPPGVPGELYIGGTGLARNYLDQPGLTAERFVADPYARTPGARLYRTGDWARWNDGLLDLLGRTDDQIKIRGVRIECGEIASILREHDDVGEAIIVGRPDRRGQMRLVAFIVPARQTPPQEKDLQAWLRVRLPESMIPSAFVAMARLPRTAHGKVDRRALQWEDAGECPQAAYAAPQTDTEQQLAAIWSSLLGIERISLDDDFLELGGNSLQAIQCIHRLREALGVELDLLTFFDEPSLRRLAGTIDDCRRVSACEVPRATP